MKPPSLSLAKTDAEQCDNFSCPLRKEFVFECLLLDPVVLWNTEFKTWITKLITYYFCEAYYTQFLLKSCSLKTGDTYAPGDKL